MAVRTSARRTMASTRSVRVWRATRLSGWSWISPPAVDGADLFDLVGSGDEAVFDEAAGEVGEPVGVGGGDDDFADVGHGVALPSWTSRRAVPSSWARAPSPVRVSPSWLRPTQRPVICWPCGCIVKYIVPLERTEPSVA